VSRSGRKTPTRSPLPCKDRTDVKSSSKASKEHVRKVGVVFPEAGRYILGMARPRQNRENDHM
jgi:hypothetical protein